MPSVLSIASPAAGTGARTIPSLCAAPSFKHYRRSTTNRAPRKRTFLLTMEKYNMDLASPTGVANAFANNVAMLSIGPCFVADAAPFSGDGNGFGGIIGGGGNNGGGNGHGSSGNAGGSSGDGWRFAPVLGHALLGALAIILAAAAFPAQSRAMMSAAGGSLPSTSPASTLMGVSNGPSPSGSPKDGGLLSSSAPTRGGGAGGFLGFMGDAPAFGRTSTSPIRPRSKVMHVACKGSTLVVPLTGVNGEAVKSIAPRCGPWQRAKIVDAPIVLSGNEAAVLELPQYRVRESMLV